jgi:transcriptional regulator with XRE-family HTH domain
LETVEQQVGKRIRAYRAERDVTLAQLAGEVSLTKGQLSKIENGKVSSPVSTLTRVARALGVPIGKLFDEEGGDVHAVLIRASDQKEVVGRGTKEGHSYRALAYGLPFQKAFEPSLMTIDQEITDPEKNIFQHAGHEFLFMLSGTMLYRHGNQTYIMAEGDSLFFDGSHRHGPVGVSHLPVKFLSVIANRRN